MSEPPDKFNCSVIGSSDEVKDICCEPCQKDGQQAVAEGYCVECSEYLCGQCYKYHRRYKALENHVLIDKDSMPRSNDTNHIILDVCVEKCNIHSSKVIEFFCETCSKLGCQTCVPLSHGQCAEVKHIPDIVKDLENSEEFKVFDKKLNSAIDNLYKLEDSINTNLTSNREMRKLAKQELTRQRAKVNQFFDRLERQLDEQMVSIEKRNEVTLKDASDKLDILKKDLHQLKSDFEKKERTQKCALFIEMTRSKEKLKAYDDQFDLLSTEAIIQRYTLLPSKQIDVMMRNITEMGRLTTARIESKTNLQTRKDDIMSYFTDFTIVHGHFCVVVDEWDLTNSITVIDTKRNCVASEIKVDAKSLMNVTTIDDDYIAVSVDLPDFKSQIQIFSLSELGIIKPTSRSCPEYYGQCPTRHRDYLFVHGAGNILMLGKTNFCVTKRIEPHDKGSQLFLFLSDLAVSPDGRTLYGASSLQNKIVSMTLNGQVQAICSDLQPSHIGVDTKGYVYVDHLDKDVYVKIYQLNADLSKVQVIMAHNNLGKFILSSTDNKLYVKVNGFLLQLTLEV